MAKARTLLNIKGESTAGLARSVTDALNRIIDRLDKLEGLRGTGYIDAELEVNGAITTPKVKITADGGIALLMINQSGLPSKQGRLVSAEGATDAEGYALASASEDEVIGVELEDDIAQEERGWVVIAGVAYVLLKNSTVATIGNWVKASDVAGRADASNANFVAADIALQVGHCIETQAAGTDVLARVILQFN